MCIRRKNHHPETIDQFEIILKLMFYVPGVEKRENDALKILQTNVCACVYWSYKNESFGSQDYS
jgi:hypothetical protein